MSPTPWISPALEYMATETAVVKRSPALAGGKRGVRVATGDSFSCTPVDAVSGETRQELGLESFYKLYQVFAETLADVLTLKEDSDTLTVNSVEYMIRYINKYDYRGVDFYEIYLEEIKE